MLLETCESHRLDVRELLCKTIELRVYGQDNRGIVRFDCWMRLEEIQNVILRDQLALCGMSRDSSVVVEL